MIHVSLETPLTECGSTVDGTVEWHDPDGKARVVRVELGYHTEGRGDRDEAVVADLVLPAAPAGQQRFSLAVPARGPISVDGALLRVVWHVAAIVDLPLRPDDDVEAAVTVFPAGGLALWARLHAPPPLTPPPTLPPSGPTPPPASEPPGVR